MNDNDRVVVYAEMNHGGHISEKELRGIIKMFEDRGFSTAWYERIPANKWVRAVRSIGSIINTGKKAWDSIE